MTLQSVALAACVVLALGSVLAAWSLSKRLALLNESYWKLRYELGQLRSRVSRLELQTGLRDADPELPAPKSTSPTTFVPLSSLKK